MQAALTAAERGHQVILSEKTNRLGGVLLCESNVSFKEKLDHYLTMQAKRVSSHPLIEIRMNTPATKELADEMS